ncbi:SDR family NAD(P)-dependent oxidoreductase [Bizionia argentinensis]|uniref:SDR family NAD(P)-dependent oxidoreductase n=1 Tax=Bizionia argentinensis TaxID=456455 RepID=UPI0021CD6437|nr:SDR family NAD(P)-dependent oxidoreductase [Bizionia argentinensis]
MGKTNSSLSATYSATKYAMLGFSGALFKELRGDNIKVTCVNPGSIETHLFEDSGIMPHDHMLQPQEVVTLLLQISEVASNLLIDEITLRPLNPTATK